MGFGGPLGGAKPAAKRSGKWPIVRKRYVTANPLCAVCGCKTGLEVHHKKPFHLFPELELDVGNLITLGEACPTGNHHLLFGHLGWWQSWNATIDYDVFEWSRKIKERPR